MKILPRPERRKWLFTLFLINVPAILHEILHLEWFSHYHLFGALYVLFISHFINFWTFINLCVQDPGFIQKIVTLNLFRNTDIKLMSSL